MKKRMTGLLTTAALLLALVLTMVSPALALGTGDGYTAYNLKWLEGGKLSFDVEKTVDRSSYYLYLYDAAGEMVGIEQTSGKPTTANADGSYTWVVDLGKEMAKPGIYRAVVGLYRMEALAMSAMQGELLGKKVTSPDYTFGGGASTAGSITLDAPTNLRWVVDGDTVSVAWDPGANMTAEDSYEVSVSNTSTGWGNMVAPTKDTFRVIVFSQFSSTHLPGAPTTSDGKYTFTVKPVSGDATKRLSRAEGTPCATAYLYPSGQLVSAADGTPVAPPVTIKTAYMREQSITIDGKAISFQAYALKDDNGNETNYVKLRDVAMQLNGTSVQFNVGWSGAVNIETGKAYVPNGTEMQTPFSGDRAYTDSAAPTNVNGAASTLAAIVLNDDKGAGYTYYKLRDLGTALGFKVDWSAAKGITVDTGATAPAGSI